MQFVKEFQVFLMPALSLFIEVHQQRFSGLLQIWADEMFPLNTFSYENDVHNQHDKIQNLLAGFSLLFLITRSIGISVIYHVNNFHHDS